MNWWTVAVFGSAIRRLGCRLQGTTAAARQDQKALMAFYQAHAGEADPTAAVMVPLGVATVRTGETVEIELRLPAHW